MTSASRMLDFTGKVVTETDGNPKNGEDYRSYTNLYGFKKIGVITRWKDGCLHAEGGLPAVEFEDTHTEFWQNGRLHNTQTDEDGQLQPAVIADYQNISEYWIEGARVPAPTPKTSLIPS